MNSALVNLAKFEVMSVHTSNVLYDISKIFPSTYYKGVSFPVKPVKFGIFGSVAQGNFTAESDLDLVVICGDDWTYRKFPHLVADMPLGASDMADSVGNPVDNAFESNETRLAREFYANSPDSSDMTPLEILRGIDVQCSMVYEKPETHVGNPRGKAARRSYIADALNTFIPEWMDVIVLPETYMRASGWIQTMYSINSDDDFHRILLSQIQEFDFPKLAKNPPTPPTPEVF